ncbi:indolepyruvate ferredoxin oxidoreductase subunit alpha [Marinobacterium rhizophilum]|uniref:Indolepyruvate ferredoxin oxidoreductase subunit alpha n=1 Tax=Marinobacterium rhizophilum TaxID=420402 RepID=A0ABY5HPW5_9GAMM|nr:indolepyruvate ferredoxin oxidoreductase subunit alpha [Marinobacterium rhizophilum]UTW14169.1 indolepyruvate ferredoxin oxidoreductase subunit alpha [Marinobacterium rhizophilum]
MAERSFKSEVKKLHAGEGELFHGEGILAVTKALLQSGVSYVGGYQGSPISHLMDVLADAREEILDDMGIHFETSASEATAAAMLSASVHYPLRGAVTWKSTVGTNVASDALANLASGGVTGGAVIIIGEDYGEGSSIMQERTHAFAMKSHIWLLDPRPNLPSIVDMVEKSFELSEASHTPVMLQMRIRACHVHGQFVARDNRKAEFTLQDALQTPRRDLSRLVLPPATFLHEREKIEARLPAAIEFIKARELNEFFPGSREDVGIILQGGSYNTVIRALEHLGLADAYGQSQIPLYVMNVAFPLIDDELLRFAQGKSAVLLVEEGNPEFIEHELHTLFARTGCKTLLQGKAVLPRVGEYTTDVVKAGIRNFLQAQTTDLLQHETALSFVPARSLSVETLTDVVPARPAGFCTGCPERPIFSAIKLLQKERGDFHISCDIGCHLFSILPPFNLGATTMGYGLGSASASAFNVSSDKPAISIMGDGGFWHNGLTSGVGNAVFNKSDGVNLIIDNAYTAATGGQDILSSRATNTNLATNNPISRAVEGVGVKWVRTLTRTYDVTAMLKTLREAVSTKGQGPKVIVAQSECMLNLQRREKRNKRADLKAGKRVSEARFAIDEQTCTGDRACIRLSGCPSLTVKENPDPWRSDPVTRIDNSCVGCGLCGENVHADILCPSFVRVEVVRNAGRWETFRRRLSQSVIRRLQKRAQRRHEIYQLDGAA